MQVYRESICPLLVIWLLPPCHPRWLSWNWNHKHLRWHSTKSKPVFHRKCGCLENPWNSETTTMEPKNPKRSQHGFCMFLHVFEYSLLASLVASHNKPGVCRKKQYTVDGSEILHHLGCTKICKSWAILHIDWCRIPSINSMTVKVVWLFWTLQLWSRLNSNMNLASTSEQSQKTHSNITW